MARRPSGRSKGGADRRVHPHGQVFLAELILESAADRLDLPLGLGVGLEDNEEHVDQFAIIRSSPERHCPFAYKTVRPSGNFGVTSVARNCDQSCSVTKGRPLTDEPKYNSI